MRQLLPSFPPNNKHGTLQVHLTAFITNWCLLLHTEYEYYFIHFVTWRYFFS